MMFFNVPRKKNQQGMITNILLITISSAAILIFAMQVTSNSQSNLKQMHILRVKQAMSAVEGRVRALALSPTTYIGCNSSSGVGTCQVDMSKFSGMMLNKLYSTVCKPNVPCGVELKDVQLEIKALPAPSTEIKKTFKAVITYTGLEASLRDIEIAIEVPVDILQSQVFNCSQLTGGTQPIFMGFDTNGKPICRGFVNCAPGTYISSVDDMTVQPDCQSLPTMTTCPTGKVFSKFVWEGGTKVATECIDRKNPYDVWPMDSLDPKPKDPPPPIPEGDCAPTSYTWYNGLNVCSGKMGSDQYAMAGESVRVYTAPGASPKGYIDAFCQTNGSWSASIGGVGLKGEIVCAP